MIALTPPAIPSWKSVLLMGLASGITTICSFLIGGAGAMLAASGGFVLGSCTISSVALRDAWWRIAIGAFAAALALMMAHEWTTFLIVILLTGVASYELKSAGTRCLIAAIFGLLTLEVGHAKNPDVIVFVVYGIGIAAGLLATWWAGLAVILPRETVSRDYAVFTFLFLTLGLIGSIALTILLKEPRAYWIAFVFAMRGFIPLERQVTAIWYYGAFSGLGVCLSVMLQVAGLPMQLQLLVALGLAIIGLKYVAHPLPVSAFAFTGAIVIASTTTMQDAVYRVEAIAIVVVIVLVLSAALNWLWIRYQRQSGKST